MQIIKKLFTRFFLWACQDYLNDNASRMLDWSLETRNSIDQRFKQLEKTSWKIKTTKMFNDFRDETVAQLTNVDCSLNDINSLLAQLENKITDLQKEVKQRKNSPQKVIDEIQTHAEAAMRALQNKIVMLREMEKNIVAQTYSFQQVVNRLDKEKSKNDTTRKGNSPEAEG